MIKTGENGVLCVCGPTGSGKSNLALKLADRLNGEIVSVDSAQVFRMADIGSAKLGQSERAQIKHCMIDVKNANESVDVAWFCRRGREEIERIQKKGRTPVLCGGTNLYLKSLLCGVAEMPGADSEFREKLAEKTNDELHSELKRLDSERALKLHVNDRNRIIRALELLNTGVVSVSEELKRHSFEESLSSAVIVVVIWPREELYQRINMRAEQMLKKGLIEETEGLISQFGEDLQVLKSLGYRHCVSYLKSDKSSRQSLSELKEEISRDTRRYAKQQMTFWRNEPEKRGWITASTLSDFINLEGFKVHNWSVEQLVDKFNGVILRKEVNVIYVDGRQF